MNSSSYHQANILSIENVCVRFGGLTALNNVTLKMAPGSLSGLIGPNGAGKTTVFNTITGLYKPYSGSVYLQGEKLVGKDCHKIARLGVSRTFQNIRLFSGLTVLENLLVSCSFDRHFWPKIFGFPSALKKEKKLMDEAMYWLEFVGILPFAHHMAVSLPYGSQRKLEIARAMMAQPKLLLLDEPAAGMNPSEKVALAKVVMKIAEKGLAILLIEHDMKFVMSLCKDITVLDHGEVIAYGQPEDIQSNPAVIEAYLGVNLEKEKGPEAPVEGGAHADR